MRGYQYGQVLARHQIGTHEGAQQTQKPPKPFVKGLGSRRLSKRGRDFQSAHTNRLGLHSLTMWSRTGAAMASFHPCCWRRKTKAVSPAARHGAPTSIECAMMERRNRWMPMNTVKAGLGQQKPGWRVKETRNEGCILCIWNHPSTQSKTPTRAIARRHSRPPRRRPGPQRVCDRANTNPFEAA